MSQKYGTRYPLSAPMEVGVDNLTRLGLTTEATAHRPAADLQLFSEIAVSGHAPYYAGPVRLNYGATDPACRDWSLNVFHEYIEMCSQFPRLAQVNIHPAPMRWPANPPGKGRTGDYGLMIDGIRSIADAAATVGIEVVLENNDLYWDGVGEDTAAEEVDWLDIRRSFGTSPEEWLAVYEDVARPNLGLCLDSSHVCTYAHSQPPEKRVEIVMAFLSRPEPIKHVHWNDNYLYDVRGRTDSHALVGRGSLPVEFHRFIKTLDATILLEHFLSVETLEEELEYIAAL